MEVSPLGPGRDDPPERHRRRARDPHQALPDLRRRGRRAVRGDGRDRASCAASRDLVEEHARSPEAFLVRVNPKVAAELLREDSAPARARGGDRQALPLRGRRRAAARHVRGGRRAAPGPRSRSARCRSRSATRCCSCDRGAAHVQRRRRRRAGRLLHRQRHRRRPVTSAIAASCGSRAWAGPRPPRRWSGERKRTTATARMTRRVARRTATP